MTVARLPLVAVHPLWRVAQVIGLVLTVALLAAFVLWPAPALHLLWDMVIPLLPAVFLVNPMLWRNVCPLATLNDLGGSRRSAPVLAGRPLAIGWGVGVLLLALMVPARRFVFNTEGVAMAVTVSAVAVLALGAGFVVSRRGGFCNSLCPVLPVEKLYGQAPLLDVGSARCADCNRCAALGCPDIAGRKSASQSVSAGRGTHWLLTPFALFAGAFPGFVIGYFSTANGALSSAANVYMTVAAWAAGSLAISAAIVLATKARPAVALFVLGALSIGAYYWFAVPPLVEAYGGGARLGEVLRALVLVGIAAWAWRGLRRVMA